MSWSQVEMARAGGIDLGGTKIEATLFDENWQAIVSKRKATPTGSYDALLSSLAEAISWLEDEAGTESLPVGIGVPGFQSRSTGIALTANLPASGHSFSADLIERAGRPLTFENDCNCFALSEAVLGAGQKYRSVFGLILGTGIGGGIVLNGGLIHDKNGASGEYGHLGVSYSVLKECGLDALPCGCGRVGCYETYLAGPGLSRIAKHVVGQAVAADEVAQGATAGDAAMQKVMALWARIAGDFICTLQCTIDPECIVLGGGLSKIPDLPCIMQNAAKDLLLPQTELPAIVLAQNGDSSGTRGAALAARNSFTVLETTQ